MTFQICSDLHLEYAENRAWFKKNPLQPKADYLIIAGDFYYLDRDYTQLDFLKKASEDFKEVYIIPGNHEYYGGFDVAHAFLPFIKKVYHNVTVLDNKSVEIEDVLLIFSTFWSVIEKNIAEVLRGVPDFRRINYNGEHLRIDQFNQLHEKAFQFVQSEVNKGGKQIVVTHHLPSINCSVDEYKNSKLNDAFSAKRTAFILENDINYWVYGHSHRNKKDFSIGNTRMVTNQFGYVNWAEHLSFNYERTISL